MTYKRSSESSSAELALLAPARLWRPEELLADLRQIPAAPGIYAVWLDAMPAGAATASMRIKQWGLAYIGIAGAAGRGSLRRRLRQHLKGPSAGSTLRRAIAALLCEELALQPQMTASGKIAFKEPGEARISAWLAAHARWGWVTHPSPAQIEVDLIQIVTPPLNVAGLPAEASAIMRAARARLRHAVLARV